jgi:hypothetical protein
LWLQLSSVVNAGKEERGRGIVYFLLDDILLYMSCMKKVAKGQEKSLYEVVALKG